jgi:organic hydroperoxide reductase OsmC/OhrA
MFFYNRNIEKKKPGRGLGYMLGSLQLRQHSGFPHNLAGSDGKPIANPDQLILLLARHEAI